MKVKSTKKIFIFSILSMLVCAAMLAASTYAWFSDTAKTAINKIAAGNLDVELLHKAEEGEEFVRVTEDDNLFGIMDDEYLWEPGMMVFSDEIKVSNVGDLALKYALNISVTDETRTTDGLSLTDVIKMKIVTAEELDVCLDKHGVTRSDGSWERSELWNAIKADELDIGAFSKTDVLEAGSNSEALVAVLYWEPGDSETDNKYNDTGADGKPLRVEFGINVYAVQASSESDSFGKDYDLNAMAQHDVAEAVTEGFKELASVLSDKDIEVGDVTFDDMTGEYTVELTFGETASGSLLESFKATQDAVAKAVWAQKDNIISVKLGDSEEAVVTVSESSTEEELSEALYNALKIWGDGALEDIVNGTTTEMTCPVAVVDAGGTKVVYNIIFNLEELF